MSDDASGAELPGWWCAPRPDYGPGQWDGTVISGRYAPGECPAPLDNGPRELRTLNFAGAHLSAAEIALDGVRLGMRWSEFDDCTFRQRRKALVDGAAPQGLFDTAVFRRCRFVGVRWSPVGRFRMGQVRFADCVFDRCHLFFFARDVDFIRCRFVGPVKSASFHGRSPDTGRVNEIVDNDFTAAQFRGPIGWYDDFPLDAQRWPTGYVESLSPRADGEEWGIADGAAPS